MNHKSINVLRLLLKGAIIQDAEDRRWTMTEDHQIGILTTKESDENTVMICDFTMTGFIGWAESLSDDAIFIASANITLNEIRHSC